MSLFHAGVILLLLPVFLLLAVGKGCSKSNEEFVSSKMKEKLGRAPDEVRLERSSRSEPGKSNIYVGTARYGKEVWDVEVWTTESGYRRRTTWMRAKPRGQPWEHDAMDGILNDPEIRKRQEKLDQIFRKNIEDFQKRMFNRDKKLLEKLQNQHK